MNCPDGLGLGYVFDLHNLLDSADEPVNVVRSWQDGLTSGKNVSLFLILRFVHTELAPELIKCGILL